jgi:hypothetical protein
VSGGRRSALEEVFDEASQDIVARVGPGRGHGDASGSVDLVESLVEGDGEDVLLERIQGQ